MTAPAATRPRFAYIPALDGIRGIWVVIGPLMYHARPDVIPGGILGIDLFFVLSSYLITSIALNEWEKRGSIDLVAYAGRRVRRLLPALLLALSLLTLYLVLYGEPGQTPRWTGAIVSTLTYSANWYEIASGASYFQQFELSPLRHVWSFAIEEQFYVFAPLFLIAFLRWFKTRALTALLIATTAGAVLSAWWMGHLYDGGGDPSRVYYGTDTRAHSLLVGMAVAVAVRRWGPVRAEWLRRLLIASAYAATVFFAIAIFEITERTAWMFEHGGFLMVAVISALMVLGTAEPSSGSWHRFAASYEDTTTGRLAIGAAYAALLTVGWAAIAIGRGLPAFDHWPYLAGGAAAAFAYGSSRPTVGPLHWLLEHPISRWVGKISYGLYLYHWPIYLLVTPERAARLVPGVDVVTDRNWLLVIHLALTFAMATVSYYLVEQPVVERRLPVIDRPLNLSNGVFAGATAIIAILGGLLFVNSDQPEAAADTASACAATAIPPPGSGPEIRVLVIGDSVSVQIAESLCRWSAENPGRMVVWNEAHLGCVVGRYGEKRIPEGDEGPVGDQCSGWNDPATFAEWVDPEVISWPASVQYFEPDIVLGHITPWDVTDRLVPTLGDEWTWLGQPDYDEYIASEYRLASEVLTSGGAQLYWLRGAHLNREIRPQNSPERIDLLNDLVAEATADLPLVDFIDYPSFVGDVGTARELSIRHDGVHLSPEGLAEIPGWLTAQILPRRLTIRAIFATPPGPSRRNDGRDRPTDPNPQRAGAHAVVNRRLLAGIVLTVALLAGTAAYSAFWLRSLVEDPAVVSDAVDEVLASRPVRAELSQRLVEAMKTQLLGSDAVAAAESFGVDVDAELFRVAQTAVASPEFRDAYRQTLLDLHAEIFAGESTPVLLDELALTGAVLAAAEIESPTLAPFLAEGGLLSVSSGVDDLPELKGIDERLSMVIAQGALVFLIGGGIAFALHPVRPVVLRRTGVWLLGAAAIQIIAAIAFPPLLGRLVDGELPLAEAVLRTVTDRLVAPAILIVVLGAGLLFIAGRWYRHHTLAAEEVGATAFLGSAAEPLDPRPLLDSGGHSTSLGGEARNRREARV